MSLDSMLNLTMSDSSSQNVPHSEVTRAYVQQTAVLLGLNIPNEYQDSVVENFDQLSAIAQKVMEFPLPSNIEIAPVFKP